MGILLITGWACEPQNWYQQTALHSALCLCGWQTRRPGEAPATVRPGGTISGAWEGVPLFRLFALCLGEGHSNPDRFPQLLGQSWLFMNEAQEGEERACVTPAVGQCIHSLPATGWALSHRSWFHFGDSGSTFLPPVPPLVNQKTKHACALIFFLRVCSFIWGR